MIGLSSEPIYATPAKRHDANAAAMTSSALIGLSGDMANIRNTPPIGDATHAAERKSAMWRAYWRADVVDLAVMYDALLMVQSYHRAP